MSAFSILPDTVSDCADFRDPNPEFRIILISTVGRGKDAQIIGVHGELEKSVITLLVMSFFLICQVRQWIAWTSAIQLWSLG